MCFLFVPGEASGYFNVIGNAHHKFHTLLHVPQVLEMEWCKVYCILLVNPSRCQMLCLQSSEVVFSSFIFFTPHLRSHVMYPPKQSTFSCVQTKADTTFPQHRSQTCPRCHFCCAGKDKVFQRHDAYMGYAL